MAGLAETFPAFPISDPFLPDSPGFRVPPDSIFPPQLRSSSRPLPSIFISTSARMFSVSSLLLTCPNHSRLRLRITVAIGSTIASSNISSFIRCSNRLTPIAHRIILIYIVAKPFSWPCFAAEQHRRSNHCPVYHELQFCWNFLIADRSIPLLPFRTCLCLSLYLYRSLSPRL